MLSRRRAKRCRAAGRPRVKIYIVNLREELPPFYRRLGYIESGTLPFPIPEEATRPCHFIVMSKACALPGAVGRPGAGQMDLQQGDHARVV